jgi:hypothetical protein
MIMDKTREADLADIRADYHRAPPQVREQMALAAKRIMHESPKIRSMREALVREQRNGRSDNVKDINEWVNCHPEYRNDRSNY